MDINEKIDKWIMEGASKQDQIEKIFEFFKGNPQPKDPEIHKLAGSLGMDEHQFEETIYYILGSFIGSGKAKEEGVTAKDVDPKELKMGKEVEKEHSSCVVMAERIALDHLAEIPDYYTRLAAMEEEGKKAMGEH